MSTTNFSGPVDSAAGFVVNGTTVIDSTGAVVASIKDTLAQGSVYVGGADNLTAEISAKGDGKILVGNGTTITSVSVSGAATLSNAGVLTLTSSPTNIALTSGHLLVGSAGTNLATDVAVSGDVTMASTGAITIAAGAVTNAKIADSAGVGALGIRKSATVLYDFAVDGGVAGTIVLTGSPAIPDNAVVWIESYDVITTCQSATDAATIALQLPVDGLLNVATAITDGGNPWDAGVFVTAPGSGPLKCTAARVPSLLVAGGENLTAGKIVFQLSYWVSQ